MKYATFSPPTDPAAMRLGIVAGDRVIDATAFRTKWPSGGFPSSLLDLIIAGPDAWRRMADLTAGSTSDAHSFAAKDVRWRAPILRPRKNVMCLGLNYFNHLVETSKPLNREIKTPDAPIFFTKPPTAINGPYDPIPWDRSVTEQVDYEVELGVVIGMEGRNIRSDRALNHVFGYTIVNDVSARDVQYRHKQWFKGKSLDGFCPMGPCIVTADEFGDPQNKRLSLTVNGEQRQHANTSEMIYGVAAIIEWLSRGLTLEAGDIIATGTPEGVGLGRKPPEYLSDGDVVEAAIEGIGAIRNEVKAI
jgi:2-keto-4-pentenoate hydratase/2-oxohepta-3-ene-1,7-dioic acid hydratase in catechol pathway